MIPDHITGLAKKYVEYDMILTHTELPEFPVPRVNLLYTFLKDQEACSTLGSAEICSIAAFLVQLGMDTHDCIDTSKGNHDEKLMRSRQLKVLAGDYYSSVFYDLLARNGNIEIVHTMSAAICEVNLLKVDLYTKLKQMMLTAEEYIKTCVGLKMRLFLSLTSFMDKTVHNIWKLLLTELSTCEVVMNELNRGKFGSYSDISFAFLHMMETGSHEDRSKLADGRFGDRDWASLLLKYKVKESLMMLLKQSVDRAESLLSEFECENKRSEINAIILPIKKAIVI